MICRMWRGWSFHVLRLAREDEAEFVTLAWFDSRDAVRSFAGENYELPVISPKAQSLLSRHSDHCDHCDLSGFEWPGGPEGGSA